MTSDLSAPFGLQPQYHRRVWGGQRLRPSTDPIGEVWVVDGANPIADGPLAGCALADAAHDAAGLLLGGRVLRHTGTRFPLVVKLLDTAAWLSVQVHPDDAQAARLEGPDQWGKAEAWYVVEAAPEAEAIVGPRAGVTPAQLVDAIGAGTLLDVVAHTTLTAGDALLLSPGTIHALGPGLLVYEVQQASDITYRVFDWHRPQTAGRALHVEQSLAVARAELRAAPLPLPAEADGTRTQLLASPWFSLDLLCSTHRPIALNTAGETFQALTVVDGAAELRGTGWSRRLGRLESVIVPAACGTYELRGNAGLCRVLLAMP